MKKSKKNKKLKDAVIAIFLVLILVVIIIFLRMYLTRLNTEDIVNNEFYQYFGGQRVEYTGVTKISKKGEITAISTDGIDIKLDSTPMFYKNEVKKVLFPETMLYITPMDNGKTSKVLRFSDIYELNKSIYIKNKDEKKQISNGFIYDGIDLYFFIENTTVIIDGKKYELSPFSYLISSYKNGAEIYNYEKDEYQIIESEDYVIAKTDSYIINTSVDTLKCNGKEQLLLRNVNAI